MTDELKRVARIGAQPVHPIPAADTPFGTDVSTGMTLRQWYAGLAMQGLCANRDTIGGADFYARIAVEYADALLKELNRE